MKTHSLSKSFEQYAWASVKGPGHILHKLPNQDACAALHFKDGILLVVSDGVGTKKHSDVGSKAVVKAVFDATKKWCTFPDANAGHLIRLIHLYWDLYILPFKRDDCAATCLFTLILHSGRCIMGQIGDGAILFKMDEQQFILHEKDDDYANTTTPINAATSMNDWAIEDFYVSDSFELLICTDGVSEDLVEEHRFKYIDHLLEEIGTSSVQKKKNKKIKRLLTRWKNPYNSDDKSLIIYRRKIMEEK